MLWTVFEVMPNHFAVGSVGIDGLAVLDAGASVWMNFLLDTGMSKDGGGGMTVCFEGGIGAERWTG